MLKRLARKIILREKSDSKSYVSYLRKKGVSVGDDVIVYSPLHTEIDLTCPCLLTIGNHVRITRGVIILTHDYSWSVLKLLPENKGRILGAQSPVKIGDNVFIGMNAIITRGVTIGNNVVIGAGSVVTKDCESDSVYAGNPAKRIMSIYEFLEKRIALQFEEAKNLAHCYYDKFGKFPPKEVFYEYFMLFCSEAEAQEIPAFCSQMSLCENLEDSIKYMESNSPLFSTYDAFIKMCFESDKKQKDEIL